MRRILLVLALAACGGGTQRSPTPVHTAPTTTSSSTTIETQPKVAAALTTSECEQLTQHIVQVSLTERPADQQVGSDEQAKIDWRPTIEMCRSMRRETYSCAIAATTTTALAACDQRTPSSSTSNSSVAPGGMTPPAPR